MTTFIIDFETTGLNPYHDDIIDIGCKVLNEDISFQCLVRPKSKRLLSDFITKLTGITNKLIVKEGIDYMNAYQDFFNFIVEHASQDEPNYLVAHNGDSFDFIFFRKIMRELLDKKLLEDNIIGSLQFRYIDTIPLAKRLLENRHKFSLQSLCKTYNIEQYEAHRAYPDVLSLEDIYNILCGLLSSKIISNETMPELVLQYINLRL